MEIAIRNSRAIAILRKNVVNLKIFFIVLGGLLVNIIVKIFSELKKYSPPFASAKKL
jgi:hypothetical protein